MQRSGAVLVQFLSLYLCHRETALGETAPVRETMHPTAGRTCLSESYRGISECTVEMGRL